MRACICIPFLLILTFSSELSARNNDGDAVVVRDSRQRLSAGRHVLLYEDASSARTFEEVRAPGILARFTSDGRALPIIGPSTSALWVMLTVTNRTGQQCVMEIDDANVDTVDVYRLDDAGWHKRTGALLPYGTRDIPSPKYLFNLDIPENSTQTFLVRMKARFLFVPITVGTTEAMVGHSHRDDWFYWLYIGLALMILLYNALIYAFTREVDYLHYSVWVIAVLCFMLAIRGYLLYIFPPWLHWLNAYPQCIGAIGIFAGIMFGRHFLQTRKGTPRLDLLLRLMHIPLALMFLVNLLYPTTDGTYLGSQIGQVATILASTVLVTACLIAYRMGYRPARYYALAFGFTITFSVVWILQLQGIIPVTFATYNALFIGTAFEMVLFSIALGDKINIMQQERYAAQRAATRIAREKSRIVREQNLVLEQLVGQRTAELRETNEQLGATLEQLRATQTQLIQSEKMASLGQLTAGIAHEIRNPLNFVNNFAALSTELVDELRQEIGSGGDPRILLDTIEGNLAKIREHSTRADGIVRNMMFHAHGSGGSKEATDLNLLLKETVDLAMNDGALHAPEFPLQISTDYDPALPRVDVSRQHIGRVILNLLSNAIDATHERWLLQSDGYRPLITLRTRCIDQGVEISVIDNGPGISEEARSRMFEPFFSTKGPGKGIGLGLSLSYDIIVMGHGGTIECRTPPQSGTELVITLPAPDRV